MARDVGRVLGRLQQLLINPVVRPAWDLGLPIPGDALLETTGRRTGLRRRTPVCDGLDGETFWLVAHRGRDADWVRNIGVNPRVRVKVSEPHARWRSGTAHIVDDDDPRERQRILSQASLARRLCISTSKALGWQFDTSSPVAEAVSEPTDYGFVDRITTPDGTGIPGGIGGGARYPAHVIFYVGVPNVEAALAEAERLGGKRQMGPERAPTGLVVGHFTDPEGNLIGVAGTA